MKFKVKLEWTRTGEVLDGIEAVLINEDTEERHVLYVPRPVEMTHEEHAKEYLQKVMAKELHEFADGQLKS